MTHCLIIVRCKTFKANLKSGVVKRLYDKIVRGKTSDFQQSTCVFISHFFGGTFEHPFSKKISKSVMRLFSQNMFDQGCNNSKLQ